ncbi:hypothetical protein [Streptomyces sp. TRM49041]|uniref:hypothetical protein n=1 Tax=Streptomyces sp. TRM49041 TaxID=2603216 RepID=UPI0011ECC4BD|nr:hypothetical protein [Streptomyces sp. TRM49041]
MHTQLRDVAAELATLLWREHTLYRERSGGVVIRGEHVRRWISLSPRGTRDEVLIRAGRILDGGTTAPARSEVVVSLATGRDGLAAVCRRLLADTAADTEPAAVRAESAAARTGKRRTRSEKRAQRVADRAAGRADRKAPKGGTGKGRSRHTSLTSWLVLLGVIAAVGVYAYSVSAAHR